MYECEMNVCVRALRTLCVQKLTKEEATQSTHPEVLSDEKQIGLDLKGADPLEQAEESKPPLVQTIDGDFSSDEQVPTRCEQQVGKVSDGDSPIFVGVSGSQEEEKQKDVATGAALPEVGFSSSGCSREKNAGSNWVQTLLGKVENFVKVLVSGGNT